MKMKRLQAFKGAVLLFSLLLCLPFSGCTAKAPLEVLVSERQEILPSENKVAEFLRLNKDYVPDYAGDACFNITPDFVKQNSSFTVFKYESSTAAFLLYDGKLYEMGASLGGFGVTSMALADLNKDGQYELYFTFSWGSGLHRSQIGYFDPADKAITVLDYSHMNTDLVLTKDGGLTVREAAMSGASYVHFTMEPGKLVGSLVLEAGAVVLKEAN